MTKLFFVLSLLVSSFSILAYQGQYRIGLFGDTTLDNGKITHIIIVGSAEKSDSDQFFQSGVSRAIRLKEVYPDHQVVIMSSPEVRGRDDDKVFFDYKINVVKFVNNSFDQNKMIEEIGAFTKIQSLAFFGHSAPWYLVLGKTNTVFDPISIEKKVRALKDNFLPGAYVSLNSCNSGIYLAPTLSEYWSLPVSGTLTSGLFERIEMDGKWYHEEDYTKENYTENNQVSFNHDYACELTGACVRMKPSRFNYSAYWGVFKEGGLSFPKFFCNFENTNQQCEKAMALSLMAFPSVKPINLKSNIEDFKAVLFDWLCQTSKDKSLFGKCVKGIEEAVTRGDLVFKSHTASELICDFKSCHAKVTCKDKVIFGSGPRPGSCKLETTATDTPTNTAREFLSFLQGFKLLK